MDRTSLKSKLTRLIEIFVDFRKKKQHIDHEIKDLEKQIEKQNDAKKIEELKSKISQF